MNKLENALIELLIEESWRISCKLMREIMNECGEQSIPTLLASVNLLNKWNEYVLTN